MDFPSYWNVVSFYAFVLELPAAVVTVVVVVCAVLVFVPVKYLYPSRTPRYRGLNLGLAGLWLVLYAAILVQPPDPNPVALGLSIANLAYSLVASVLLTSLNRFRQVHTRPADVSPRLAGRAQSFKRHVPALTARRRLCGAAHSHAQKP